MAKKPQLGIYFSDNFVNIVEQQDGKVLNFAKAPCIFEEVKSGWGQTVAHEEKIVNLLKETLLNNNIITQNAVLTILTRDLIIRFFDIPIVSSSEIESTVGFEVKRYIPFKLEELIFDFQTKVDKKAKKFAVSFVAAKREIIDKYISILEQAGLNIVAIEPVFLSILRAIKLAYKIDTKTPLAVVDVDSQVKQGDITIIENFYPRFSRDLNLRISIEKEEDVSKAMLYKLLNEIRISLDYCRRQFPSHALNIDKLMFLAYGEAEAWTETLQKEMEMPVVAVNIKEKISLANKEFDLELTRAYGAAIRKTVAFPLKIDLFAKAAAVGVEEVEVKKVPILETIIFKIDKRLLVNNILVLLGIISLVYIFGWRQLYIYKKEVKKIKDARESLPTLEDPTSVTYQQVQEMQSGIDKKIAILESQRKNRHYLTNKLSTIAALRPKGLWLTTMGFRDGDNPELVLTGFVYLEDEQEEFLALNGFLSGLKNSQDLSDFRNISLGTVSHTTVENFDVTTFEIFCR